MKSEEVKKLTGPDVKILFPDPEMRVAVMASVGLIAHLQNEIKPHDHAGSGPYRSFSHRGGLLLILPVCQEHPDLKREDNRIREQEKR